MGIGEKPIAREQQFGVEGIIVYFLGGCYRFAGVEALIGHGGAKLRDRVPFMVSV
jgi:hypothetical protein